MQFRQNLCFNRWSWNSKTTTTLAIIKACEKMYARILLADHGRAANACLGHGMEPNYHRYWNISPPRLSEKMGKIL